MDVKKAHEIIQLAMKWKLRSNWEIAFNLVDEYRRQKELASENFAESHGDHSIRQYARMCQQTANTYHANINAMCEEVVTLERLVNELFSDLPEISELVPIADFFVRDSNDVPQATERLHKLEKRVRALLPKAESIKVDAMPSRKGVSLRDAAMVASDLDGEVVNGQMKNWRNSRNPKLPPAIGGDPNHKLGLLYDINELLTFVGAVDGHDVAEKCRISLKNYLREAGPFPKQTVRKPSAPSAKSNHVKSRKTRKS